MEEMVMETGTVGVTIRELYRHAAAVLDELERSGRGIVISRYGRAVAYLGPLPDDYEPGSFDRIHALPRTHAMASLVPEDEIEIDDSVSEEILNELTDRGRDAIAVLVSAGEGWKPLTADDLPLVGGCSLLELHSLAEKHPGSGWTLTSKGRRVVEMLGAADG
jgi:antitoxin (DNA-binding transcriptional repressor) of toxin-antitoxin stability system